jgi:putative PIN family toxin of toxin-antitoxin system
VTRLVIDTNVLVSAIIRDANPEAVLIFASRTPGVEWVASASIMDEYLGVLSRPKLRLPQREVVRWRDVLRDRVRLIEAGPMVEFAPDPKDAMLFACCLAAQAAFLITGDRAVLDSARIGPTVIVNPAEFKRMVIEGWTPRSNGPQPGT